MKTPPPTLPTRVKEDIKRLTFIQLVDTGTSAAKLHTQTIAMPPTPTSDKPPASSPALPSSSNAPPSSPPSDPETPRETSSISNRFWEKNAVPSSDGAQGIDLASDSSDPDDNSEAANTKSHNRLDSNIKRLLALESGPVRLKTLATNEAVLHYTSLLDAFAHKPKTKKKRAKATEALQSFLEEHDQVIELYNQYAKLDRKLCRDRVLPEFEVQYPPASKLSSKDSATDVRRAPAKHAHNDADDSDEEGIVAQTIKQGEAFDAPSVFNTRGLSVSSIFGQKSGATKEKNERKFVLFKRDVPLKKNKASAVEDEGQPDWDEKRGDEGSPTRARKKRKLS
ncbi:hypothetical protein SLS60_011662 [Paraconiothyrium brasiliense]|uniref:Uncharacterized protein n=1 Tax=Paraconiothyrium brasiliense TaxID=300254 RepID=A0ABR3QHM9_9PLEO